MVGKGGGGGILGGAGVLIPTQTLILASYLATGCFSLFGSTIITVGLSLWFPQSYDWNDMKSIAMFNDVTKDVGPPPPSYLTVLQTITEYESGIQG
jgi:hypothetical protein